MRCSDSKSLYSNTLHSIVSSNTIVGMALTLSLISFKLLLRIVPSSIIMAGMIITLKFHYFLSSMGNSRYLYIFAFSFRFILLTAETVKSNIWHNLFFLLTSTRSSGLDWVICLNFKVSEDFTCSILISVSMPLIFAVQKCSGVYLVAFMSFFFLLLLRFT